jgi:uncharacterized damage-inducible protein DinB
VNTQDVLRFFAYDWWANRRLLAAASRLTPVEFTREMGASFGSVQGTLGHIMKGEARWLHFWVEGSTDWDTPPEDFPDAARLETAWSRLETQRHAFATALGDSQLEAPLTVRGQDFTLAELIHHIVNHSTYHRGQVVLLLRQLGHTPPSTDYRLFLSESR